ncbi:hypothetical protein KIW84_072948 [Lathyrus oleraceus]|uniref:Helitron helicase-like domain-containing protein n=1 Tax=Pisum sativum TaxID=3888 RepID=A0A9D4VMV1_PEA|nr:hypothetical protein KIW84_072948 [Pisum sativum]
MNELRQHHHHQLLQSIMGKGLQSMLSDENITGDEFSDQDLSNWPRSTTNSFVRPFGVNLFRKFKATTVETSNSSLTPPQTTTHETSHTTSSILNQTIPQHNSNHSTNSYVHDHDSDMGSNISSNGNSDSDMDIDDDYLVDDHLQDPIWECQYCLACMWYGERMSKSRNTMSPKFQCCCHDGKVKLPLIGDPPAILQKLLFDPASTDAKNYQANTRTYNVMFSFISPGMKFDTKFIKGGGSPTLRLHGQTFHRIGTMLPEIGQPPKYAQLYIFDTDNEIQNRMECSGTYVNNIIFTLPYTDVIR